MGRCSSKGREIEQALVAAGLRYEKKETRAFGGCSRVAFRVFATRDQVPVSTYRGADVQVRISGKRLERIRFRPLSGKPRYLIVGIDRGQQPHLPLSTLTATFFTSRVPAR